MPLPARGKFLIREIYIILEITDLQERFSLSGPKTYSDILNQSLFSETDFPDCSRWTIKLVLWGCKNWHIAFSSNLKQKYSFSHFFPQRRLCKPTPNSNYFLGYQTDSWQEGVICILMLRISVVYQDPFSTPPSANRFIEAQRDSHLFILHNRTTLL